MITHGTELNRAWERSPDMSAVGERAELPRRTFEEVAGNLTPNLMGDRTGIPGGGTG